MAISIRLPFFVYAATLLIAGSIGLVFLAQSKLQEREESVGTDVAPTPLSVAMRQRAYWAAVTNNLATGWSLFGIRGSVLPLFVTEAMLLSESWVSIGIFISALAQGVLLIPAGRASDMRGRRPSMIVGSIVVALAFVLLAAFDTIAPYALAMVLFGFGSALIGTSSTAVVGDVVHGRGGPAIAVLPDVVRPRCLRWTTDRRHLGRHVLVLVGIRCHRRRLPDGHGHRRWRCLRRCNAKPAEGRGPANLPCP